jgi:hypothetical protein
VPARKHKQTGTRYRMQSSSWLMMELTASIRNVSKASSGTQPVSKSPWPFSQHQTAQGIKYRVKSHKG